MSVFLSREQMWDMPLGGSSEGKQIPHWCGNILWAVIGAVCKLLFRYRVDGRENIRSLQGKTGCVIVGNHTSYLDVVFFYLAVRTKQWIRLMGRDSLFETGGGLGGQILSRVGAFPVKRGSADRTSVKRAVAMLKRGEVVGIYPEGTRRGKGSQKPELHSGGAFIARMGKAPLVPATVRNAEKVKVKGKFFRFPKITVEFGEPIEVSEFDFLPKEDRLDGCTWYVMRECYALSRRCASEEVDMRALFPDGRDFTDAFRGVEIRRGAKALREEGAAA